MKLATLVLIFAVGALAGGLFEYQGQQIGEQCTNSPTFNVTSFYVNPWPTGRNQSFTFNMTGFFNHQEFVSHMSVGTNYNRQEWNYTHYNISSTYTQGSFGYFVQNITNGYAQGNYLQQITLHSNDTNRRVPISCWQFRYFI